MALLVRPVDLDRERCALLQILTRNLPELDHARRFHWRYLQNPAGHAYAWFLCDGADDRIVGAAAVIPRYAWLGGTPVKCGQVGDFAVDAAYRSLGPAIRLQRATFAPVENGDLAFCYDCPPHQRGMATFHRLGLPPACRADRFSKPLRVDSHLRRRMRAPGAFHALASLAVNTALWIRDLSLPTSRDISVAAHTGPFEDEFSNMDRRISEGAITIRNRRYAEDLEWRFRGDPLMSCEVIAARRSGELIGFAAFTRESERAHVLDLSATSGSVARALLAAITRRARAAGLEAVDALAVEASSTPSFFRRAGFIAREPAAHVVPYALDSLKESLFTRDWTLLTADVMG